MTNVRQAYSLREWITVIIALTTIAITIGISFRDLQDMKDRVIRLENAQAVTARESQSDRNALHNEINMLDQKVEFIQRNVEDINESTKQVLRYVK